MLGNENVATWQLHRSSNYNTAFATALHDGKNEAAQIVS
jgi:hypothetical protein